MAGRSTSTLSVKQHEAVHLTRQTNRFNVICCNTRLPDNGLNALNDRLPPLRGSPVRTTTAWGKKGYDGEEAVPKTLPCWSISKALLLVVVNIKPQKVRHC